MYYIAFLSSDKTFPSSNQKRGSLYFLPTKLFTVSSTNPFTIEFSDADLKKIENALLMLEETFAGKLIRDISFEKQADKAYEIENLCAIPGDDGTTLTLAMPAFVNITQWGKDEKAREQLHPIATRLKNIAQQVVNTNRAVLQRCWNSSSKY